jgi:vacuolar-type H+-ATPase subunit H
MGLLDSIKGLFTQATEKIDQTADLAKNVVENSSESFNEIKEAISTATSEIAESGKEFIAKSSETISHAKDIVVEKGSEIIETAKETITKEDSAEEKTS